ncbi:Ig-like domain-containing protein [Tenacibaculum amylolyticum]|uniref:Ig-like domain-containing protein n=1 Tax=Tenacibaculum amylolyticum TaxID=104269 RepID=UPI003895C0BA
MKLYKQLFFIVFSCIILLSGCARKGSPSGGPKDETAPIMVIAKPAYESLNFDGENIRIYFDEYIILRDLNKKLIVSPPFKNPPLITPQGTPSKYINIKILDTLKKNTTYTFNFGDAILDNNENNKLENFKYVFSTGDFIDSLTVSGSVIDIKEKVKSKNYNVLLYKVDSTFNDSIIYKRKPDYVTKTIDSLNFKFTNVSDGDYRVFALEEETSDYLFNSKLDQVGFFEGTISLPKDSVIIKPIILFKEDQPYKFKRGKELSKGKINFGFTGKQKDMKVEVISKVPADFKAFSKVLKDKDSLIYWHTPIKADSLNFIVTNNNHKDTTRVKLRKKKIDSLTVSSSIRGSNLHLADTLFINTNNPIVAFDKTKFSLVDADTVAVNFEIKEIDFNKLAVLFEKKPNSKYNLEILPKAIEDLYKVQSKDTIRYTLNTKEIEDYGSISLNVVKEIEEPIIIELIMDKKVVSSTYLKTSKKIDFTLLEPKKYTIRAIVDSNENGVWDTGSYLLKIQPERIIYFPEVIEMRANWSFNETLTIKKEHY